MINDFENTNLFFKGVILPKTLSTSSLIDLENGFVLTDERKEENKRFSYEEIYTAIKKQNPKLLESLNNIDIASYEKKGFEELLKKDGLLDTSTDKIELPKSNNKLLNTIFDSLKSTIKKIFYKESKFFVSNSKIKINNESCCLGWFKTNVFEMYIFADDISSTLLEYYINGHSNTLKNKIDQVILAGYKKFLILFKEEYLKTLESDIVIGANIINKSIVEKHFIKNPKYYIAQIELEENKTIPLYITLKKAKNV